MPKNVICISRAVAAGGEEIARIVTAALGYRYVDDEIISRAAQAAGVSPEVVQQAEHTRPLITRILESMAGPGGMEGGVWGAPALPAYGSTSFHGVIQDVIRQVAQEGNVVIVAHAASIPLAGMNGLLRVLVTASPQARAARLGDARGLDSRAAATAVHDSDRQREQYLRRFYQVQQETPLLYDLVINTDVLGPQAAAQTIIAAARS